MRTLMMTIPYIGYLRKYSSSTHSSFKLGKKNIKSESSTVDEKDVNHHGQLSNEWWDINGKMCGLHSLNSLRVPFVRDGLANVGIDTESSFLPLHGTKILDVGCGGGILSEPLARIGADVTGIDASKELIETAKQHASLDSSLSDRLHYINTSIEEHSEQNLGTYDAVVASEILEHVSDPKLFLKSCIISIKPGGSLFVTTLNKTMVSWLGAIITGEYILNLVPRGTHDWNQFISPTETRRLIESEGCQTKLIHGMGYNPLSNKWCWISSTAINYALHAIKKHELGN